MSADAAALLAVVERELPIAQMLASRTGVPQCWRDGGRELAELLSEMIATLRASLRNTQPKA
jgi:hypothetical protein